MPCTRISVSLLLPSEARGLIVQTWPGRRRSQLAACGGKTAFGSLAEPRGRAVRHLAAIVAQSPRAQSALPKPQPRFRQGRRSLAADIARPRRQPLVPQSLQKGCVGVAEKAASSWRQPIAFWALKKGNLKGRNHEG